MYTIDRQKNAMKSPQVFGRLRRLLLLGSSLLTLLLLAGCDSLQVDAPELTPPLLQTPADAQVVQLGSTVTFSWQNVDGASRYECEVRQSDDDGKSVTTEYTDQTTATLTFDVPGAYSWRVRARNADDEAGYWSESWLILVQVPSDP